MLIVRRVFLLDWHDDFEDIIIMSPKRDFTRTNYIEPRDKKGETVEGRDVKSLVNRYFNITFTSNVKYNIYIINCS